MSLGYIGYARYKQECDGFILYEYSGENWNAPYNKGDCLLYDGLISIEKNILCEENWGKVADEGKIKIIKPCKNAFYRYVPNFDYIALVLISKIFREFKEKGCLPDKVSFAQ